MYQKLISDSFLILVNNPKQLWKEMFQKIGYFERGLSKRINKINFIFSFKDTVFFNGYDYEKQEGPGTSDQ